jgi:hypothetical protein
MDRLFPFGFPGPTAFYLGLYVLTLVVHVLFMNYVLAGVGYLAFTSMGRRHQGEGFDRVTIRSVLTDWMPFATSAAITAGVAPLLFVQILYKKGFYTANLLLFHRWMAILPVLIVGFYLLYLLKSKWIAQRSRLALVVVSIGALACFAFTGLSWTENHLLSTDRGSWPGLYESGAMVYSHPQLLPRLGMWAVGAIPTMCLLVAWQLFQALRRGRTLDSGAIRRLAVIAVTGIVLCGASGGLYWSRLSESARQAVTGPLAGPFLIAAIIGLAVQVIGWIDQARHTAFCPRALSITSLGLLVTVIGMTAVREAIRLAAIDLEPLYARHQEAAAKGGLIVFIVFFIVNALLIAWCLRLTMHSGTSAPHIKR